jgi:hypothetical protein
MKLSEPDRAIVARLVDLVDGASPAVTAGEARGRAESLGDQRVDVAPEARGTRRWTLRVAIVLVVVLAAVVGLAATRSTPSPVSAMFAPAGPSAAVADPSGPGGLRAVACPAPADCVTDKYVSKSGQYFESWDGTSWRSTLAPAATDGATPLPLSVSCSSPGRCVGVGFYEPGVHSKADPFISPLAGDLVSGQWTFDTVPVQPSTVTSPTACSADGQCSELGGAGLLSVSCAPDGPCIAVGSDMTAKGQGPLAEEWNGSTWSLLDARTPAGFSVVQLNAVSCSSADACLAVGSAYAAGGFRSFAELWNGARWSVVAAPLPMTISAIGCVSASECVAVGSTSGRRVPAAQAWNGASWLVGLVPLPPHARNDTGTLSSLSCLSFTACIAVGVEGPEGLAEMWNGQVWSIQPTPRITGSSSTTLEGVSCTSTTFCMAVGMHGSTTGGSTLAEVWDGRHWALLSTSGA